MKFHSPRVQLFVFMLCLAIPLQLLAQSPTSATAAKNVANNVNTAKNQVMAAQQSLVAAQGRYKESESKNNFQMRHVRTVRAKVYEEHDKSSVLSDARKEVERLDAEFKTLMKPILDHVRAQSDFRALTKKHEAIKRQIEDDGNGDEPLTEGQRSKLTKEALALLTEIRQIEKAAVLENSQAKAAYANVQAARERLKELCTQRDQEIASDSNLTGAYSELESSKQELEQAKVQVQSESQKLAMAEQQLAAAMAAQAAAMRRTTTRRRN